VVPGRYRYNQAQNWTVERPKNAMKPTKMIRSMIGKGHSGALVTIVERGLNENTNGLLRQYFPKNTDLKKVSQTAVNKAVKRLNPRPRKDLAYRTPRQLMSNYCNAVAA